MRLACSVLCMSVPPMNIRLRNLSEALIIRTWPPRWRPGCSGARSLRRIPSIPSQCGSTHVYGPQQLRGLIPAALQAAQRAEVFNMTRGEQWRDFIYITDVIEALRLTLTAPHVCGKTYDIGTGVGVQVRTAVQRIFEHDGQSRTVRAGRARLSASRRDGINCSAGCCPARPEVAGAGTI